MKKLTTLLAITAIVIISACSQKTVPAATNGISEKEVKIASEKWPGTTAADLAQGKTIYEANCGKCHKLFSPSEKDEATWNAIVPPMCKKAQINDPAQEAMILKYVVSAKLASEG